MMKKRFVLWLLSLTLAFSHAAALPATHSADPELASPVTSTAPERMRGVWVSSVYNLDYPSKTGMSVAQLKKEADTELDQIAAMGLNTVFFQVRPCADALYSSSLFPWSKYVSGTAGVAPADGFDPLAYWVEGAHARGLELHAWINPYRITKGKAADWEALPAESPAKQHPEWTVVHEENYYFNPGLPAVQQYIVDGALEIVRNYAVDGIHLDDYFYPGTDFADSETYARYGAGFSSIDDWRRNNVNTLIAKLDTQLHALKPSLSFGVSPSGIWDNITSNPRGSDTRGFSSYRQAYCDTLAWVEQGTVDYICPQIYWHIGNSSADFATLTEWWQNAVKGSDVDLYIGLGAYRMVEAEAGSPWEGTAELDRQLTLLENSNVQGYVLFRYGSLQSVRGLPALLSKHTQASTPPSSPSAPTPSNEPTEPLSLFDLFSRFITNLFC